MKNRKFTVSLLLTCIATLLGIVGFIFFLVSNATQGNSFDVNTGLGISMAVIGLISSLVGLFVSYRFADAPWAPLIHLVTIACYGVLFGFIILNRVELISSLFTWDSMNTLGWSAFRTSIVSLVFYVLASIVITVAMFFPDKKKDQTKEAVQH